MIEFPVDQNFNEEIVDGLTRRDQTLEFTYARDVGFAEADDPTILEWAARQGMVLLTHDRKTVPSFAYDRIISCLLMPGVFLVAGNMPVGRAIDELLIAVCCLSPEECKNVVTYFPM